MLKNGKMPSNIDFNPLFEFHFGHISINKSLPSIKEGMQKLLFVKTSGGMFGYPGNTIIKKTTKLGTRSFAFSESIPIIFFSIIISM